MLAGWLALALSNQLASAQHRRRPRLELGPDAATMRRCGRPLPEPVADPRGFPDWARGRPFPRALRWPPTSPCFREQERRDRAIHTVHASRIVSNCWQNLLRINRAVVDAHVRIRVVVDTEGRFGAVRVLNSPDPRFRMCIEAGVRRISPLGPGLSVEVDTAASLTTGG